MFGRHDAAGTTPVAPNEERFLRVSVRTVEALNQFERENILRARRWLFRREITAAQLLDHLFIREIHRRMFRDVWTWAGKIRDCDLQHIGVAPHLAETRLCSHLEDAKAWVEYESYPVDELCIRVHHGLVVIHPWRNGNGRHARLVADRLVVALGGKFFSWGRGVQLDSQGEARTRYLEALRTADAGDFKPLVAFARE